MDHRQTDVGEELVGREHEFGVVRAFVNRASSDGGALVLSGQPGVGKTALLAAAVRVAREAGTRVLYVAGVESETGMAFSWLHQVLCRLHRETELLDAVDRAALSAAVRHDSGGRVHRSSVSAATLALVRSGATSRPLLIVVDDAHRLDRPSAAVLGFVARRLAGSRIGLIAASGVEGDPFLGSGQLPEYEVLPLGADAASQLLELRFPGLAVSVRQRVQAEGQGNPLALLELPAALSDRQRAALEPLPEILPLSRRLRALFTAEVSSLPARTTWLLLLAALEGSGELAALRAVSGENGELADLAPAEQAGLVGVERISGRLTFRHPAVRSTVVSVSTDGERRRAHLVLAEVLTERPERRAWHLAGAAAGPDEQVAALLDEASAHALRRGDANGAVAALLRAADLSPRPADRGRRLVEAAYVGAGVAGQLETVPRLLIDASRADPELGGSLHVAIATAYLLVNEDGDVDTAHRVLSGAIDAIADPGDARNMGLIEALHCLAMVCFFGGRAELWEPFHAAVARLEPEPPPLLDLLGTAFADPARLTAPILRRLDAAIDRLSIETDPVRILRTGIAASHVDRLAGCRAALWRIVHAGRDGGAVTSGIEALFLLGNDDYLAGRWDELERLCEEGLRLSALRNYRLLSLPGIYLRAMVAAVRGDHARTRALTAEMGRWAAPRKVGVVQVYVAHVRTLAALGCGDFETAYLQASTISPPGVLASHVPHALWLVLDLVEAAVRTGRHAEASAHVEAVLAAGVAATSARLTLLVGAATAISAPAAAAGALFEQALAVPGVERWPFHLARVHLAYGEHLRRTRAVAESRVHLVAALDGFERLSAAPWTARARNELRAAGRNPAPMGAEPASLTPQERAIALLAATGLTNKQIGQRLLLSPRTIGAHLYRIFPKLGIASRAALRDALDRQRRF
ncbi:AAA family ATPase [Lentzea waywayandensis]|uniref:AAA family ATPase n=1 Tax=Lentzea waywayandensis TaxID=84724 RepID=UPI000B86FE71|nr:LuxR family transcriptional regulator [Lentzea waywayandensis]